MGLPRDVTVIRAPRDTSRNSDEKRRFASAALTAFMVLFTSSDMHYFSIVPGAHPGEGVQFTREPRS